MQNYQVGDKSKAICSECNCIVETTFLKRDVPFSDTKELAKGILVAVCNRCDQVVGLPAQESSVIKRLRE